MKTKPYESRSGFTLVELLMVMLIAAVVMTGIFSVFRGQQRAHLVNSQTIEIQQNLRAGLYMMERDARLAGYSPSANTGATITEATRTGFRFTWDDNEDGDVTDAGEDIAFGMGPTHDADNDGVADDGLGALGRSQDGGAFNPIANNIQAVAFAYAYDDDLDKDLDPAGPDNTTWGYDSDDDGDLDTDIDGNPINPNIALDRIRAVRIWLLARSRRYIGGYEDNRTYNLPGMAVAGNGDPYLRRMMVSTIKCRNMGLRPQTAAAP
jgi:type IV pilus assembly protein PilW